MVNLLFEKYDNFGLISGRIWQVPLCSSHIDLHTDLHTGIHTERHTYLHTDVRHVNRSGIQSDPAYFRFRSAVGLPSVWSQYVYQYDVDVSVRSVGWCEPTWRYHDSDWRCPVILDDTTSVSFACGACRRRPVVQPSIPDRHQDDTKAACIPPRRHLDTSPCTTWPITLVSGQRQIDARCIKKAGHNRCWGDHQSVVRFERNSMTTSWNTRTSSTQ